MESSTPETISDHNRAADERTIPIFVNDHPITIKGQRQTGRSIKLAAIAQKIEIGPEFVLSIERGAGRTDLIGDDEEIRVHPNERFLAIPNDDNS